MWCMHPHGTSVGFGFTLNGAIRFRAEDEAKYSTPELSAMVRYSTVKGFLPTLAFTLTLPITMTTTHALALARARSHSRPFHS